MRRLWHGCVLMCLEPMRRIHSSRAWKLLSGEASVKIAKRRVDGRSAEESFTDVWADGMSHQQLN